nr:KH domain-containing protein [Tanacetum cinerariifolium]
MKLLHFRVFSIVGVLIGKAGSTIRTLQNSSGARIQITRDAEADPHSANNQGMSSEGSQPTPIFPATRLLEGSVFVVEMLSSVH